MRVVLADYGAGNLRSVCSALARAGAEPVIAVDPEEVLAAPLAVVAGVGHAGAAARRPRAARRCAARPGRGRPARARHLRRHAALLRAKRGGRQPASGFSAGRCGGCGRDGAAHGLERRSPRAALRAARRPRRRRRLLRPQLRRRARGRRHRRSPSSTTTARSSPPVESGPSPASSSIPSGAAPPAPACSRTRCDGQEAPDPLPRRRRRPRRQGRPLRDAARRRRSGRARRRATPSSAPTSSSSSTSRRAGGTEPAARLVERAAESLTIPFTVGGGISGLEDARALLQAGADKVAVNRAAFDDPALLTTLADEFGSQAVVCAIDSRAGEWSRTAGACPAIAPPSTGPPRGRARRRRAARHLDRRRRDAGGYDLELTGAIARRSRCR